MGSYHAFDAWRQALRRVAPGPDSLPGSGGLGGVDTLQQLLLMPDDEGSFSPTEAADLAKRLERLVLQLPPDKKPPYPPVRLDDPFVLPDARAATRRFIAGLRRAAKAGEPVVFNPPVSADERIPTLLNRSGHARVLVLPSRRQPKRKVAAKDAGRAQGATKRKPSHRSGS